MMGAAELAAADGISLSGKGAHLQTATGLARRCDTYAYTLTSSPKHTSEHLMMIAWGHPRDMVSDSAYLAPCSWILMLWRMNYKVTVRKGRNGPLHRELRVVCGSSVGFSQMRCWLTT